VDEVTAQRMRRAFWYVNRWMVVFWRLGFGRWVNFWPAGTGRIMVLTHVGRKSGRRFRTPLNFAEVDGEVYCTAGFGARSDWYLNVTANPLVEVWLPGRRWAGTVDDVSDSPDRPRVLRAVLIASGFAAPAAGVPVQRLTDDELAALTTDYRLLRIAKTGVATGDPRPGDLAWIWAAGGGVLGLLALFRRRRRRAALRDHS
jgi:deazaflavin-dependent oxidoreductase (nitroreductase family)